MLWARPVLSTSLSGPRFFLTKAGVPHTVVIPGLHPGDVRRTTGSADLAFKATEPGSRVCALSRCTVLPSLCFTGEGRAPAGNSHFPEPDSR